MRLLARCDHLTGNTESAASGACNSASGASERTACRAGRNAQARLRQRGLLAHLIRELRSL